MKVSTKSEPGQLGTVALAAIVFALLGGSHVRATDSITFDSTWWNGLSADEQTVAVESAIDSYISGNLDGQIRYNLYLNARSNNLRRESNSLGNDKTFIVMANSVYLAAYEYKPVFASFGKTFGTYVHGISDFYANHPEASKSSVGEIMACLADKPRETCDQVAKYRSTH